MLYESYERRVSKLYSLRLKIYVYRFLLMMIGALILLVITGFTVSKGIIYDVAIPSTYSYGDDIDFNASALFSDIEYEYRLLGETEWIKGKPKYPGHYQTRITSKRAFGQTSSKIYDLVIEPKEIDVTIKESIIDFGSELSIEADLEKGDYISQVKFEFGDLSKNKTSVIVKEMKIFNQNNQDVTPYYKMNFVESQIEFRPRKITISLIDKEQVYSGITLTSNESEVTKGSTLEGHTIEITTIGSQTDVGSSTNKIVNCTIWFEDIDVTENYDITFLDGTLLVTKRPITIKPVNVVKVYDGTPLISQDYEITSGSLVEGHTIKLEYSGSQSNVGSSYSNIISCTIWDNDVDVTKNYDITFETGLLEVEPRPITIKTHSDSKVYNKTPLSNPNYDITEGTLADGHNIVIISAMERVDVGTTNNTLELKIYDEHHNDVSNNYQINYNLGTLTVTPRSIAINTSTATKVYDGTPLSSLDYNHNGLIDGHKIQVKRYDTLTDVGIINNKLEISIFDDENVDVSNNYHITYYYGTLEVTPRPITVKPKNATKAYDGTPLISNDYEVVLGSLIMGHEINIVTANSQTNVGSNENEIIDCTIWNKGINVTNNYTITYEKGALEVTPRPITIKTADDTKAYDGTPLANTDYNIIYGTLSKGHRIEIINYTSIIDVGISTNSLEIRIYDEKNNDITNNYNTTYELGTLKITPRLITIETASDTKAFDAIPLFNSNLNLINSTLVYGHRIEVENYSSITTIGRCVNEVIISIYDQNNNNVTTNYHITYQYGVLEITTRLITIRTHDANKVYDGTPLDKPNYDIISGNLLSGHHIEILNYNNITNVGKTDNILEIRIYDEVNNDVTEIYEIKKEFGTLEVTPKPITIKTSDATKVYDGTNLYNLNYNLIDGSLLDGHHLVLYNYNSIVNAGEKNNNLEIKVYDESNNDITYNYEINYIFGTLRITPRVITIKPTDVTKVYDGKPLRNNEYEIISGSLISGHTLEIETSGSQVDRGTSINKIIDCTIWDGNIDVTSNYDIVYTNGTLEVTPRPITITLKDVTKVYDGLPLTSSQYDITYDSLVDGHAIELVTTGSQTNVGTSINTIETIRIWNGATNVTDNYSIICETGTLNVTHRPITIKLDNVSKVYDGTPLTSQSYTITSGSLVDGHILDIITLGSQTDVGTSENIVIEKKIWNDSIDVTSNYLITIENGTLEVTPQPISIKTADGNKVYDGTPLSNLNFDIIYGTLVAGHTIDITSFETLTTVGTVSNNLKLSIYDKFGKDVTKNYEITFTFGTLEVTPRPITIETHNASKVYDGMPLSNPNYDIISGSLVYSHIIQITHFAELTNVGTVNNNLELCIYDEYNQDVTYNYEITFTFGTLKVNPRPITIVTADDIKVYDGNPLFNLNHNIIDGSLVTGHVISITEYQTITNVGTADNVLEIIIYDSNFHDITHNYQISFVYGKLTITPRPITIKPKDNTKVYDGTPLTSDEYEITSGSLITGHEALLVTSGMQTNVGVGINEIINCSILDKGHDVTSNYDISFDTGTLEVTPRPITIATADDTKVYDRTPLFNLNYTLIDGSLVTNHRIEVSDYTSITNIGTWKNKLVVIIYDGDYDVTSNYKINYVTGTLEITPIYIEISSCSAKKTYDGTPLQCTNWELTKGSILSDHHLSVTVTGSIVEVGRVFNTFTVEILDSNLNDVSEYYIITHNYGILEIENQKIEIHIISGSNAKEYDGSPLICNEWGIISGKLLPNHKLKVYITGSITEVGKTDNIFTYEILDEEGNNVEHLYNMKRTFGELTIYEKDGPNHGKNSESSIPISNSGDPSDSYTTNIQVKFKVFSDISGYLYLRDKSYGDYDKNSWKAPILYEPSYGISPLSYPGLALLIANHEYHTFKLKAVSENLSYFMPYYSINGFNGNANDVFVNNEYSLEYTIDYIPYTYSDIDGITLNNTIYQSMENEYRQFVYEHYLQLPFSTKVVLLELAQTNGLNPNSPTLITDIQNYIKNAGRYTLQYKPYPENADYAVHFLKYANEGICQHFATAGVAMYRAMGIPARYVTGYLAQANENEWSDVTNKQAHAWVEIYRDGFGWIPIEVTASDGIGGPGGSGGSGGTGGSGSGGGNNDDNGLDTIVITSGTASKEYDGTPLTNHNYDVSGNLKPGHELIVNVFGEITQVGSIENEFTVQIIDDNGNDVTNQYNIKCNYGTLTILPKNEKILIEFEVFNIKKTYDGTVIKHDPNDYWIKSNNLPSNYTVELEIIGEIKNVGSIRTNINKSTLRIYDENGIDVTNNYNIVCYPGSIEVVKRDIVITSFSAQKYYDGTPLTSNIFFISKGKLADGDNILVSITGSITEVGSAPNTIESVTITDRNGVDVTKNYNIKTIAGTLRILE